MLDLRLTCFVLTKILSSSTSGANFSVAGSAAVRPGRSAVRKHGAQISDRNPSTAASGASAPGKNRRCMVGPRTSRTSSSRHEIATCLRPSRCFAKLPRAAVRVCTVGCKIVRDVAREEMRPRFKVRSAGKPPDSTNSGSDSASRTSVRRAGRVEPASDSVAPLIGTPNRRS